MNADEKARMSHEVYSDFLHEELKQACSRHEEYHYRFERLLENILDTRDDDEEMLAVIEKINSNMDDISGILRQFEKISITAEGSSDVT